MTLKTAVVTGASAGIGREIVRQMVLDRGMTVLATARRRERLESLAAELPAGRVHIFDGDLADANFRESLWGHAEQTFPDGVDVLVNNAGVGHYAEFSDQPIENWLPILETNVIALFDLTQRAARHMKLRERGQIVEISSVLGFFGIPYSAVYVASKHAVNGLIKCLRAELKGTGVKAWAACPGRTESEFASMALGRAGGQGREKKGEPTPKIVRNILRGLDRNPRWLMPSFTAWFAVMLSHWLTGPFSWTIEHLGPRYLRKEVEGAGGRLGPRA